MKKVALAILSPVLLLVFSLSIVAVMLGGVDRELVPSTKARTEIPIDLIPLYRAAAATCDGMEWTLLAAIHRTETNFGRGADVSSAGAQGPMQFMPATWVSYGVDGNKDGIIDTNNLVDAVFGAANYLCANGAGDPARLRAAVFNYNHSLDYVDEVLSVASAYGVVEQPTSAAFAGPSPKGVLNNPRILIPEAGRSDIKQGLIDDRVLTVLELASRRFTLAVSVFKTGHSMYVQNTTSVSNHYLGRAVDIYAVNGESVTPANLDSRALTVWLANFPPDVRPTEVGSPFLLPFSGWFTNEAHKDHLHIGFDTE